MRQIRQPLQKIRAAKQIVNNFDLPQALKPVSQTHQKAIRIKTACA